MRDISRYRRPAAAPARVRLCAESLEPRVLLAARPTTFAVIGDYGLPVGWDEGVASMVKGWNPDLVLTVGDNNYPTGSASTIDAAIGRLYHDFIYNYRGAYGAGSAERRFFPALGNHDWGEPVVNADGAGAYLDYFDLPGNERYYDFAAGPVHFFCLDSDRNEPDGVSADSVQAQWLRAGLASAGEPWKVVYFHHPPYSSGYFHGSDTYMRWPFKGWGASAVFTGHDHSYERLNVNGLPYFVDGLGGATRSPARGPVSPFSEVRYDAGYGAMRVEATDETLHFEFLDADGGRVIDSYTIDRAAPGATPPAAPSALSARGASDAWVELSWADESGNESGFEVERSVDGGWTFDHLVTVDAGSTRYADRTTPAGATYQYRVRAVNAAGASAFAGPVRARPLGAVSLVPAGSVWKYRDDGADAGTAWRASEFDDSAWRAGPAELGYNEGDEATAVAFGPSLDQRHVTTYFRRAFDTPPTLPPPAGLRLRLKADDGAVVYLNGQEVFRWNMPSGPVNFLTRAAGGLKGYEEVEWREADLPAALLRPGRNVLAVEVHQYSTGWLVHDEADLSFDLELRASVDDAAPVAALAPPPPVTGGGPDYAFTVVYSDDLAVAPPATGAADLAVTGPNGFADRAVLLRSQPSADGHSTAATYALRAPHGAWGAQDAGVYTVSVPAGGTPVRDASGNRVAAGTIGSFVWLVAPASVSGRFWGEAARGGWGVYVDANNNGALDPGERTADADDAGAYVIDGLPPGACVVRPVPRPDWRPAAGPAGGGYAVTLGAGQSAGGLDFAAARLGQISGYAALDGNGDGYLASAGDVVVPGRTIYLDLDDDAALDAGEPSTVSDAAGFFSFAGLEPGTYAVRQVLPPGWRPTIPMDTAVQVIRLGPGDAAASTILAGTPIVADAGGPYAVAEGGAVAVSAAGSVAAGSMLRWYEWDFSYDGVTFTPDTARLAGAAAIFRATAIDGTGAGAGGSSTRTIAVRAYDQMGYSATAVTTVTAVNVAPTVDAGADGRALAGEPFALAGSFADPGPDAWAATVDWGDGAGPHPLPLGPDRRFSADHAYAAPGTYAITVSVVDDDGGVGVDSAVVRVAAPGIAGRLLFYNRSVFDGRDGAANEADDLATAPDKRALLPGQAATFANVSSYVRGINGVMIDLGRPAGAGDIGAADFVFRSSVAPDAGASAWQAAPPPAQVLLRRGAGVDGADRITLVWPDFAIRNQWLQVTVLAGPGTGLARDDVFYFGSLPGKATPSDATGAGALTINALDGAAIRRRLYSTTRITSLLDVNRDGRVNAFDAMACRQNLGKTLALFSAPS